MPSRTGLTRGLSASFYCLAAAYWILECCLSVSIEARVIILAFAAFPNLGLFALWLRECWLPRDRRSSRMRLAVSGSFLAFAFQAILLVVIGGRDIVYGLGASGAAGVASLYSVIAIVILAMHVSYSWPE